MLNTEFNKIYLINLGRSVERLKEVSKECARVGVKFERVSAIDGWKENLTVSKKGPEGWTSGARGLLQTTIKIIEDAIEKDYKSIMILEDDVKFMTNADLVFNFCMKSIEKLDPEWNFIHLNYKDIVPSKWVAPGTKRLNGSWCCQAYGIQSNIYKIYLERLKQELKPIDQITAELHKEKQKSYGPSAPIVYHRTGQFSDLRDEIVGY